MALDGLVYYVKGFLVSAGARARMREKKIVHAIMFLITSNNQQRTLIIDSDLSQQEMFLMHETQAHKRSRTQRKLRKDINDSILFEDVDTLQLQARTIFGDEIVGTTTPPPSEPLSTASSLDRAATLFTEFSSTPVSTQVTQAASASFTTMLSNAAGFLMGEEKYVDTPLIGQYVKVDPNNAPLVKLVEDVSIFLIQLVRSPTRFDRYLAIANFAKLRGSKIDVVTLLTTFGAELFGLYFSSRKGAQLQGDDMFEDARTYLDSYANLKKLPVFTKLYRFGMYALSLSLFSFAGITFDTLGYKRLESEAIKREFHLGPDMIHCFLDTLVFLCQKGTQCFTSGSLQPLYHSGSKYEEWFSRANKLKFDSQFLSNPEPHGINQFEFLSNLKDTIEQGQSIKKFSMSIGEFEKKILSSLLHDLQLIEANQITKKSAQKSRKPPFAMLIFGGSSVGKTMFKQICFVHYGKVFGLPVDEEYLYVRNAADPFWSGFNSTQWGVLLDDIAFERPGSNIPPQSMIEMLQVNNGVPFVPTQADLADKGKTPLTCKLLLATTNTEMLNTEAIFSCPLAVNRRFPFVIELSPKPEYDSNGMLNTSALPPMVEGRYPDIWHIIVKKCVPAQPGAKKDARAALKKIHTFTNINDFLDWYAQQSVLHEATQDRAMRCAEQLKNVVICRTCRKVNCICPPAPEEDDVDELVAQALQGATISLPFPGLEHVHLHPCYLRDSIANEVCYWCKHKIDHHCYFSFSDVEGEHRDDLHIYNPAEADRQVIGQQNLWFQLKFWFFMQLCLYGYGGSYFDAILCYFFGSLWKMRIGHRLLGTFDSAKVAMACMGHRVEYMLSGTPMMRKIVFALSGLAGLILLIKASGFFSEAFQYEAGISSETGVKPEPKESEKKQYYHHDPFTVANMDISQQARSYQGGDILERKIEENLCHILATQNMPVEGVDTHWKSNVCVRVCGQLHMLNRHSIPFEFPFYIKIIDSSAKTVSTNSKPMMITRSMVYHIPEKDLIFFNLKNRPPVYNLAPYFSGESLKGVFKGKYIGKDKHGVLFNKQVDNIRDGIFNLGAFPMPCWKGLASPQTEKGDCGSVLFTKTNVGPVIMGIHIAGDKAKCVAIKVFKEDIDDALDFFKAVNIERSSIPISMPSKERFIGPLDKKSPVLFSETGTAAVYGSFTDFRAKNVSKVIPTVIRESMIERGYPVEFGKPVMNYMPWWRGLQEMMDPVLLLNNDVLDASTAAFTNDILKGLPEGALQDVKVMDNCSTLNGVQGLLYCDKMNRNTSAGAPLKQSKRKFLTPIEGPPGTDWVDATPEIWERVDAIIESYHQGKRWHAQFCGHLKDEPKKFKHIAMGKVRVFCGSEMAWSIVVRKYLLPIVMLIQNNRFLFESGPGTVAQSLEWEEIREHLVKFGLDRIIAGDYEKFDKRMPASVILAAFTVIESICRQAGYSELDILVIRGIAYDTAFPTVDFNGDLIEFYGSNPSGHPLTVIINGLANAIYMRYCFAVLGEPHGISVERFKEFVALITYGDDNAMGVDSSVPWFNHCAVQKVLADVSIGYTMADKEAKSVPYITIDECSFLKRTWRWDEDVGAYLAPLDHSSISKMLTTCVDKGTVAGEAHAISVISTALREYFFYGKDVYQEKKRMFGDIIIENDLTAYVEASTLPSWESLCHDFWKNSTHVKLQREHKPLWFGKN